MGILSWIILGAIAGAIAKKIMHEELGGLLTSIGLGIGGGVIGGFVASLVFHVNMGGFFDIRSWVISILGALALLFAYRWARDKWGNNSKPPRVGGGDHARFP